MRRHFVPLALAGLFTAAYGHAEDQWIRVTSPHFELYTPAGERTARGAVQYFEQVRGFFVNSLGVQPRESKRVRIVGFKSEKEFRRFDKYQWAAAFYQPGVDRDYIVMKSLGDSLYSVAIHEYVHLLTRRGEMKLPVWLNEGIAEFYSTLKPIGGKIRVGEFEAGRYQVLMRNKWLTFEDLTGAGRESAYRDEKNRVSIFYAQSWALTHMVLMEDDYRPKSAQFIRAIQTMPASKVFEKIYGKTLAAVDKDLRGYMRGNSYRVMDVDGKLEKLAESPDIAPITAGEASLIQARVLGNSGKFDEALELLDPIAAAGSTLPEVHEALGYVHLYSNRDQKAIEHFAKAAGSGSDNPLLYRDYANLLIRSGRYSDAVVALRRNLQLEPDELDTRLTLGSVLLGEKRYGEALSELAQSKKVPPEKASRLYRMLAYSYLGLKARNEARSSARMAEKYAKEDSDRSEAARLLAYFDKQDAYEKEVASRKERARPIAADRPLSPEALPPALAPAGDFQPPVLRRRPLTAEEVTGEGVLETVPRSELIEASGTFQTLECLPQGARVHLKSDSAGALVLAIDEPSLVAIVGKNADAIELQCGPQTGTPAVRVAYLGGGASQGVAGVLRRLEFQ